jgi:asparagine synthase (glutamine-hydrolysing)
MCGISGILKFTNKKIQKSEIDKSIISIQHRGPDSQNFWLDNDKKTLLINTRLAILDISKKGNQPLFSKDKRYIIVFNGEIYNFKELKEELLSDFFFYTNTDTEVLLNLFIKYKENCLEKLSGMFSFAIFDKIEKKLFIARDPFGIKPLYYHIDEDQFLFSSEIKTFFYLGIKKKINTRSLSSYLTSEYFENIEKTFYEGILKLKPGHFLEIKNNKINIKKYFNFEQKLRKIYIPQKENEKEKYFEYLIKKSIKLSMASDVPISIAASGGLDSSILQYEALKINKNLKLVSWDFKEENFSEKLYTNKISKITKIKTKFALFTKENFIKNINNLVKLNEEPFSGTPIAAYHFMLKTINKNKVILDGSGLDEAHGGYLKYYKKKLKNYSSLSQDGSDSVNKKILNNDFFLKNPNYDDELTITNSLKNNMYNDLFFLKLPRALRFRDKISMSVGQELRPSFLNAELILSLFKLKNKDHFRFNKTKFLLRKIYQKKITDEIAFEDKRNIQTPQTQWLTDDLLEWVNEILQKSYIWELNIYNKKEFFLNLNNFKSIGLKNSFFIWKAINIHFLFKEII